MRRTSTLTLLLTLPLVACEEVQEELVIHEDGSVTATVRSGGDAPDLVDGYNIPVGGPWRPANAATETWLREVRTGPSPGYQPGKDDLLEVSARFDRVEDLPAIYAPEGLPYRTAYLERDDCLEMREVDGKCVYIYERVFCARERTPDDMWDDLEQNAPEQLGDVYDDEGPMSPEMRAWFDAALTEVIKQGGEMLTRRALSALYTRGDASLSRRDIEQLLEAVEDCSLALLNLDEFHERFAKRNEPVDEDHVVTWVENLEQNLRNTLRRVLEHALINAGVSDSVCNAVLAELEWQFTATDHTDDLGDAKFKLNVVMPGTIVSGNFASVDGNCASWEVNGTALRGADRVLRVVSVLE